VATIWVDDRKIGSKEKCWRSRWTIVKHSKGKALLKEEDVGENLGGGLR
jgi:hypothetical protein